MRRACGGEFSLSVVAQRMAPPYLPEARMLELSPRRFALIRQVLLRCDGVPWIFARSVLPSAMLKGRNRRLANLGEKPLGEVLFTLPRLVRRDVRIVPLSADSAMRETFVAALDQDPAGAWLRRSLFHLDNVPLLINEVFLPKIYDG